MRLLALDPTIGSIDTAKTLVGNFHAQSAKLGHACLVAWADLAEEGGQKGRPALHWYDDFTSLLLDIAKKSGIKASIGRDRATRERTGWLFQAAQALEPFLDPWMRSQSAEACGKRLERSTRRLRDLKRKSPRTAHTFVVVTDCGAFPTLVDDGSKSRAIAKKGNSGNDCTVRSDIGTPPKGAASPTVYLTPKEASEICRMSVSWLAKARMNGNGPPFVKFGRAVRYE